MMRINQFQGFDGDGRTEKIEEEGRGRGQIAGQGADCRAQKGVETERFFM